MTLIADQPREASHCETASTAVLSVTVKGETLISDTTNMGTGLIEEGALLPGSVQSESEPWTAFYMTGEVIRELRKAQEIKQVGNPGPRNDMSKAA